MKDATVHLVIEWDSFLGRVDWDLESASDKMHIIKRPQFLLGGSYVTVTDKLTMR